MSKQIVLINTALRTFNGVKPQGKLAVDESRVDFLLSNGFERVNVLIEEQHAKEQAEIDALNAELADAEKATKKAGKQKKTQEQLDAEYEAKKKEDELPELPKTDGEEDGEDLGEDLEGGEEKEVASDLDALNAELETK